MTGIGRVWHWLVDLWFWLTWRWRLRERKPNKKRIGLWIKALQSEKFLQGRGALRQGFGWCCLGVACEVYRLATGKGEWINNGHAQRFQVGSSISAATLPTPVARWYGIDSDPLLHGVRAITRNDSFLHSFLTIAEAAEAEYLR